MRLEDGFQDQKLSLDVTPLIDIAFILVLFFAVSTSFISGADLAELKNNLFSLGEDKQKLTAQNIALQKSRSELNNAMAAREREVAKLRSSIIEAGTDAEKLEWMIATLREQKLELEGTLTDFNATNRSLRSQLEQAYADFKALDLRLSALNRDLDEKTQTEKLLRALLLERETEQAALAEKLHESSRREEQLSARNGTIENEREALHALVSSRDAELAQAENLLADQAAQEKLLQQLLAERAAKLSELEVRLIEADEMVSRYKSAQNKSAAQSSRLQTELLKLRNEIARYEQIVRLSEGQIEHILKAQRSLESGLQADLEANRLDIIREKQRLVLQLSNRILFDSGSASIKPDGIAVLRKVGEIIRARTGALEVQIGGHTDNVPLGGSGAASSAGLSGNWGLSSARAVNVVRFLENDVGIDPARLSAVGYGEFRPVASNDTAEGRGLNRRIEIVLVPR